MQNRPAFIILHVPRWLALAGFRCRLFSFRRRALPPLSLVRCAHGKLFEGASLETVTQSPRVSAPLQVHTQERAPDPKTPPRPTQSPSHPSTVFRAWFFPSKASKSYFRFCQTKQSQMDQRLLRSYLQTTCSVLGFDIGEVWWCANGKCPSNPRRFAHILASLHRAIPPSPSY